MNEMDLKLNIKDFFFPFKKPSNAMQLSWSRSTTYLKNNALDHRRISESVLKLTKVPYKKLVKFIVV